MNTFTKEQMEQIKAQTEQVMELLSEGKSAKEVCAQMYVNGLEGKTLSQGEAMAESILESITNFDRDYARAKADIDTYMDSFLDEACREMTLAERCTYLMKLIAAISAAETMLSADSDEKREQAQNLAARADAAQIFEGEATEALECKLRDLLKDALRGSNLMFSALEAQREYLLAIESEDEAAKLLAAGAYNGDFRAIMSMQAYINIKNGAFPEIPSDISAAQTATMICAYHEEINILNQLENGSIGVEIVHVLLVVLGTILFFHLIGPVIAIGMKLAALAFTACVQILGTLLYIPVLLVVAAFLAYALFRVHDAWLSSSRRAAEFVVSGVTKVCNNIGRVIHYVAVHVKTAMSWLAEKASKAVKRLLNVLGARPKASEPDPEQQCRIDAEVIEAAVEEDFEEECEPEAYAMA